MECDPFIVKEYFKIIDIIDSYDTRLLIFKGWSVTFSLVMLALGFEKKVRELFWVAAISAVCFFLLDATYKNYQTNYYLRMRQIEVNCSKFSIEMSKSNKQAKQYVPRPAIDWMWQFEYRNKEALEDRNKEYFEKLLNELPKNYKETLGFWYSIKHLGVILPYVFPFFFGVLFGVLSIKNKYFKKYFANNANSADAKSRAAD